MSKPKKVTLVLGLGLLLTAAILPNFLKVRVTRSVSACINNLRQLDGAKEMHQTENNLTNGAVVTKQQLLQYFTRESRPNDESYWPVCPHGGTYTIGLIGESPRCSYTGHVHYISPF